MIEVRQLSKTYLDPDGGEIPAVAAASFACYPGEIYGLLGSNGAGKTTTLRCLATILTPTAGSALVAGHDLATEPDAVRRSIGFLSANTGFYSRLTPRETLYFFARLYGWTGSALDDRVQHVITLLAITDYADRPNDRLSTGMKQRVGLARALVHDPQVLILDEPTTGLDPIVTRTVEDAILGLATLGKTILLSTHMLDQAEAVCGRVGIIGHGRVLAEGSVINLCARTQTANLRDAFFALLQEPAVAS